MISTDIMLDVTPAAELGEQTLIAATLHLPDGMGRDALTPGIVHAAAARIAMPVLGSGPMRREQRLCRPQLR